MLADSVDGIHYGLVEIGGFAQHRELTSVQRRHMFTVEQGNRVAMNAMGHAQYMSAIRHQSRGFAWAGDDTDPSSPPPMEPATGATATGASSSNNPGVWSGIVYAEGGESESERTEDHLLNPDKDMSTRQGELETSIDDLRLQLNVALAEELWSDADELQRTILMLLDHTNNQGMRNPDTRVRVFQRIADSFRMMASRGERRGMSNATVNRYRDFENVYRSRTWQLILSKTYFAFGCPGMWATPGDHNAHLEAQYATTIPMRATAEFNSGLMQNCKEMQDSVQQVFWGLFFCKWDYFLAACQQWRWERKLWATWAVWNSPSWGGVWKFSVSAPPVKHSCMATAQGWHALQSRQFHFHVTTCEITCECI